MPDKVDSEAKAVTEPHSRKPYSTPRLERLGTLTEITADAGTDNMNDMGGTPPFLKTS